MTAGIARTLSEPRKADTGDLARVKTEVIYHQPRDKACLDKTLPRAGNLAEDCVHREIRMDQHSLEPPLSFLDEPKGLPTKFITGASRSNRSCLKLEHVVCPPDLPSNCSSLRDLNCSHSD